MAIFQKIEDWLEEEEEEEEEKDDLLTCVASPQVTTISPGCTLSRAVVADTTHLESELSSMNTTTTTTKEEGPASLSQHVSVNLSTIYGMRAIQRQIIVIMVGLVLMLFLSPGQQHSYDRSLPLAS